MLAKQCIVHIWIGPFEWHCICVLRAETKYIVAPKNYIVTLWVINRVVTYMDYICHLYGLYLYLQFASTLHIDCTFVLLLAVHF